MGMKELCTHWGTQSFAIFASFCFGSRGKSYPLWKKSTETRSYPPIAARQNLPYAISCSPNAKVCNDLDSKRSEN